MAKTHPGIWIAIFGKSPDSSFPWRGEQRLKFDISFMDRDIQVPVEELLAEANKIADKVRAHILNLGLETYIKIPVIESMKFRRTASLLAIISDREALYRWYAMVPKQLAQNTQPLIYR